ncbi:response regulator transcription factor [Actinoplanes derwentensis]|uniref:Two-component system, OmpR family, response regulator MtrA n=1 Tax=Actinoplanes derwentensis TaxID=113562 RepID=A0A1H2DBU4_9ACTN|nr:response regulator [Actinoplanes derwentensis]GID87498.1 hypothetical protein Ade03nite_64220 [Actinoplanes derwentensis]SDT80225.1 two-component system, OmpR family, response regulator MtrA [Actinoplanes derwentensis]
MNQNLVVIAEDDREVRDVLSFAVESAGHRAIGVRDGRTALRVLLVARPVALITDVLKPDMNGLELCRLARDSGDGRTAILMVSANAHQHDMRAGLRAGADRYLTKPVISQQLVAEMRDVITARGTVAAITAPNGAAGIGDNPRGLEGAPSAG